MSLSRIYKTTLILLLTLSTGAVLAAKNHAGDAINNKTTSDPNALRTEKGMIALDYQVIPVPGNQSIDLLGVQYFHQLNDWLYMGMGMHMPLVKGNYGGFMVFNATLHAQQKIRGNWFWNAGLSLGGGGGGKSIRHSKILSGSGGFIKSYAGLGYDFGKFSAGINYSKVKFVNSRINHSQLNVFIQKPLTMTLGSFSSAGKRRHPDLEIPETGENRFTLELNNIFQISPTGKNKNTINTLSLQYSHSLRNDYYAFISADVGYEGMPLYNQVMGGFGKKFSILPGVNIYSQIAVGSGGYAPREIDTGPGLLIYPKVSVEYLLTDNLGLSLSGGYLFAPKGTSKNYTLGAALNYRLSTTKKNTFRGFRFSVFQQTELDVTIGNKKHPNINLLSVRLDKMINDNWYIPIQGGVAYNEYMGYPGHGEILVGLGVQNAYSKDKKLQGFFQIAAGPDSRGIILKPTVGFNYSLSENLAIYGHVGKTMSLHNLGAYPRNRRFSSLSVGLGLTTRFSLL